MWCGEGRAGASPGGNVGARESGGEDAGGGLGSCRSAACLSCVIQEERSRLRFLRCGNKV